MKKSKAFLIANLSIGILLGSYTSVCAKVDTYTLITKDGQVYEYNKDEVIDAAIQSHLGFESKLFEDFNLKLSKGSFHSYHTDSGKYVSHNEIVKKLLEQADTKNFSLDEEAEKLSKLDMTEEVYRVSDKDGKLINTPVKAKDQSTYKDATFSEDLYVTGDKIVLQKVKVNGTLFVNPGAEGTTNLEDVNAGNIVILSGAKNSIHLKNVVSQSLQIQSTSVVRIESSGTTKIENTVVSSSSILDAKEGSFGQVNVAIDPKKGETANNTDNTKGNKESIIEFRGKFDKEIIIKSDANIKAAKGAEIAKLEIATEKKENKIVLSGNFKDVVVNKEAKIEVAKDAKIANILANANVEIAKDKEAVIPEVKKGEGVQIKQEVKEVAVVEIKDNATDSGNSNGSTGNSGNTTSAGGSGNTSNTGNTGTGNTGSGTGGTSSGGTSGSDNESPIINNSSLDKSIAAFDKKSAVQSDVPIVISLNGNTLRSIKNETVTLTANTDYTANGSNVVLKKEYLASKEIGKTTLTFEFSAGVNRTLEITISDTTSDTTSNVVIEKVNALPEVITLDDKAAVVEARTAYDLLTVTQKALVTNFAILTEAEAKIAELETSGQQLEEYNKPNGIYTGHAINFNVTSTDSTSPSLLGPESGIATVNSDIIITAGEENFAKLKNLVVKGNIIIDGNGEVGGSITLDNVKVEKSDSDIYGFSSGRIIVKEVATNSLHLENGVEAGQLVIEDKNGSRIDVQSATLGEVIIKDTGDAANNSIASFELSDNATIRELLVETEEVEFKDNTTNENGLTSVIEFIQADGVDLTSIATGENSDLNQVRSAVNTELKFKEKLDEINNLYKASNGITNGELYNYVNNKLRLLIENIADMELTFEDNNKVIKKFILVDAYKEFSVDERNDVAGHVNATIRDNYNGKITELYELEKIFNEKVAFVIREGEVSKYLGRGNSYEVDISSKVVGAEVQEMFMIREGETIKNYYNIVPTGVNGSLVQFYNGKFYLMKNFSSNIDEHISTKILISDAPGIPDYIKNNTSSNSTLNFRLSGINVLEESKDISFVDMSKTNSGLKIEVQAKGFSDEEIVNELSFYNGENKLDVEKESVVETEKGYKLYVFKVNNDIDASKEVILNTGFIQNEKTYNYVKRFTLQERELEKIYEFKINKGIVDGKLKIKALDRVTDYSENNKKYILNLELDAFNDDSKWVSTKDKADPYFVAMLNPPSGTQEPIVEIGRYEIIGNSGSAIIKIPLTLKREPSANETYFLLLAEMNDVLNVEDRYIQIDFSE